MAHVSVITSARCSIDNAPRPECECLLRPSTEQLLPLPPLPSLSLPPPPLPSLSLPLLPLPSLSTAVAVTAGGGQHR